MINFLLYINQNFIFNLNLLHLVVFIRDNKHIYQVF